jgi:ParB family chromosome partitioning protein
MAKRKAKKSVEPASRGLTPAQVAAAAPARLEELGRALEADGGRVLASYRDPLGGHWQLLVALPLERIAPTPFQRDLSASHVERLSARMGEIDRFLDPIILVRNDDGTYWTPNGNHRLASMRALGARAIVALLVPEHDLAYRILALNTEKSHNLREKALEVIRMARDLAQVDAAASERDHALIFEEPSLLTLGCCYEENGRFPGSVYHPVLRRTESFQAARLPKALELREAHAARLFELEAAVTEAVAKLKERGFDSPYLKNFVVSRINPLRFLRGAGASFDETLDKMLALAQKFNAAKVKPEALARSGGAPEET